jgi:two-component system, NarL family, response regulator YdfI
MTRVLIACQSEVVRRGLESLVASEASLELVGSVARPDDAASTIREAAPDVVLVVFGKDPEEFLPEGAAMIGSDDMQQPAFVVLGASPPAVSPARLLRSGIRGLLPSDAEAEEILAAIHAAAAGLIVLHPEMSGIGEERAPLRSPVPGASATHLTARERQVLTLIAEGLGNKEIAWKLQISEHTVKFHLSSIFTKLDVSSRAEAVSLGFRLGLILV